VFVTEVFEDVACTVCGCVCDDLQLTVEENRITRAVGSCRLSEDWFLEQESKQPHVTEIRGVPCEIDAAIDEAAAILRQSRSPLIYGLSRSSTEGQREAVRLADTIGANIDTTASLCHAPSIVAIQSVGESTCSLGEIRNRADLVLFWGVDPARSHPRHFERYSVDPTGEFVPRGRTDRTVVVIDVEPTESSALADRFLQIEPGRDFEAIWALRAMMRGLPVAATASVGTSLAPLRDLADLMKSCRCGVVFFGLGLSTRGLGHLNVEALLRLVAELNDYTRFHARRMRIPGDVTGADTVLCWQTGYPFSVNLSRAYPRYNPGEFSANELLERREVDACLLVGSEGIEKMSSRAVDHLRNIPTIALDHPTVQAPIDATVRFTTAVYGIHLPGTAYRMDEVPIPLKQVLSTDYPSDAEVLSRIRERTGR
jgi:formylmethanofuran dehydrogenase subunit B